MAISVTPANIYGGTCTVTVGGTNIGATRGTISFARQEASGFDLIADQSGLVDHITGYMVGTLSIPYTETQIENISRMHPGTSVTVDTTKKKLVLTSEVGLSHLDNAVVVIFKPVINGAETTDANLWVTAHKVTPTGEVVTEYVQDGQRILVVEHRVFADTQNSDRIFTIGDTTASADTTAPTISSTTPADAATGIAVGTTFAVVFSESMDTATLIAANFAFTDAAGNDVPFGTPAISTTTNANDTVTITPDSSLAASTVHIVTVTTGVQDTSGNALAANNVFNFTTA